MASQASTNKNIIGTLAESDLHASLASLYMREGDEREARMGSFIVDIKRGSEALEIQTRIPVNWGKKLSAQLADYPVTVIYPVPLEKQIIRKNSQNEVLSSRKSPKKGKPWHAFVELVNIALLLGHPNLTLIIVMTKEEETREETDQWKYRRKGYKRTGRALREIPQEYILKKPEDYRSLFPAGLFEEPITNKALAERLGCPLYLAGRITRCLGKAGALAAVGRDSRALLFQWQGEIGGGEA